MNKKIVSKDSLSNNFSKIMKSFKDKWVAVPEDYSKVVVSADTLSGVMSKIKKDTDLKIFKVIPLDMVYWDKLISLI